jgi:hypothetical protein
MSSGPEAAAGGDRQDKLGEADRVLLLALSAWAPAGRARDGSDQENPRLRLLERLEPSWARRLLEGESPRPVPVDRAEARERLRQAQRAEARVDPARVHPSWWVRGLQEESPSVRRAVVATAPEPIRGRVQSALLLDNDDLRSERPADPQVLAWTLSLWTERLVGGEAGRPDDPPVIVAMSELSLRAGYQLCRYAGELKLAIGGSPRADWLREYAASAGPEFSAIADQDIRSTPAAKWPPRRLAARIGLLTIARLLSDCEPFRVRWALQHWPYTIAKLARSLMPPAAKRSALMMQVEAGVLKAAWDRLDRERPATSARPGEDDREQGAHPDGSEDP